MHTFRNFSKMKLVKVILRYRLCETLEEAMRLSIEGSKTLMGELLLTFGKNKNLKVNALCNVIGEGIEHFGEGS